MHFDFACAAGEHRRATAGTEESPAVVACLTLDRHRILREYRGREKKSAVMLAAVEAMTKTDPVRLPGRDEPDVTA
jgi:hypothetical protein